MKNKFLQKFICLLTIFILIVSFWTTPTPISAAVTSTLMGTGSCVAGGYFASKLQEKIGKYADQLETWLASKIKEKIVGEATSVVSLAVPVVDNGTQSEISGQSGAGRQQNDTFNYKAQIQRCLARELLNQGSASIMNIIRTQGRDGGASFVRNWRNFITNAQYRGEDIFRAQLSTANICQYMSGSIKGAFGATKRTALTRVNTRTDSSGNFSSRANCTMPSSFDMGRYLNDPQSNGGWDAFARALEPQNNQLGIIMMSNDEMLRQRSLEAQSDINQVIAGGGYTGLSGSNAKDSCLIMGQNGRCLVYKDIKTTGSYLKDNALAATQAELNWLTTTGTMGDLITAGINILINRIANESDNSQEKYYYTDSDATFEPSQNTSPTFSGETGNTGGTFTGNTGTITGGGGGGGGEGGNGGTLQRN